MLQCRQNGMLQRVVLLLAIVLTTGSFAMRGVPAGLIARLIVVGVIYKYHALYANQYLQYNMLFV